MLSENGSFDCLSGVNISIKNNKLFPDLFLSLETFPRSFSLTYSTWYIFHPIFKKIFKQTWVVHAKSLLSLNTSLRGKARCISHRRLDSPFWCVHQCINIWCGALNLQAIYTVKRLYLCRGRWNSGPLSAFCSLQELIAHINVKGKCPAKSGSFEVRLILNAKRVSRTFF